VCEWLKLGCELVDPGSWSLLPVLVDESRDGWLLQSLTMAASRIQFPLGRSAHGLLPMQPVSLQQRLKLLRRLLDTQLLFDGEVTTVRDIVCIKYSDLWAADGHRLIIDRVQSATHLIATGEVHMSLVEAITGEVRDVFTNYLTLALYRLHEGLNVEILDDPALSPALQQLFAACLSALPVPPVAELKAQSHAVKAVLAYRPPGALLAMPFFDFLAKKLDAVSAEVVAQEPVASSTDELAAAMRDKIAASDSPEACVVASLLRTDLDDVIWRRYLAHFCSRLYPLDEAETDPPIEHTMLAACLQGHVGSSESQVAALHVAGLRHEHALKGLAASLKPLSLLFSEVGAPCNEMGALLGPFSTILNADAGEQREVLQQLMVSEFDQQLDTALVAESAGIGRQLRSWARAYATSELRQALVASGRPISDDYDRRLAVMGALHAVIGGASDEDLGLLQAFKADLGQRCRPHVSLRSMWECLQQHFPDCQPLEQRLLMFWCSTSRLRHEEPLDDRLRDDVGYYFSQGHGPHAKLSVSAAGAMLEMLLAGAHKDQPVLDLNIEDVVERHPRSGCAEVLEVVERQLC